MDKSKKKRSGLRFLALIIMFALAAGGFAFYKVNSWKNFNEAFRPGDKSVVEFTVERGSGYNTIGRDLEAAGLIESGDVFAKKTKLLGLGPSYQAGTFLLSPSMTMEEIMAELQDARRETARFTIPEGLSVKGTAEKLVQDGIIASESELYSCLESFDASEYFFADELRSEYGDPTGAVSAKANRFEGFLYPETYEIYAGSGAEGAVKRMLGQFEKVFDEEMRAKLRDSGRSLREILTIASLVERETREDSERARVAGVIMNRLEIGMPLQIDATQQYILGEAKALLTNEDTLISSPYNSYTNKGLPPGPIASPGIASIRAALEPEDHDYVYYVLKSFGGSEHNFAVSYDEFLAYKAAYQKTIK